MRRLAFQVAAVQHERGRTFAVGRSCGDDLVLDDVLTWSADEHADPRITVLTILAYGRYLNVLSGGMTGELELAGEARALLSEDVELTGEAQQPSPAVQVLGTGKGHIWLL